MDQIAAGIDVVFKKTSPIDLQATIDEIWGLRDDKDLDFGSGTIIIEGIAACFGDVDAVVLVKTSLAPVGRLHPTWRIAKFVEKVYSLDNVAKTNTRIFIHDPHHDARHRTRPTKTRTRAK